MTVCAANYTDLKRKWKGVTLMIKRVFLLTFTVCILIAAVVSPGIIYANESAPKEMEQFITQLKIPFDDPEYDLQRDRFSVINVGSIADKVPVPISKMLLDMAFLSEGEINDVITIASAVLDNYQTTQNKSGKILDGSLGSDIAVSLTSLPQYVSIDKGEYLLYGDTVWSIFPDYTNAFGYIYYFYLPEETVSKDVSYIENGYYYTISNKKNEELRLDVFSRNNKTVNELTEAEVDEFYADMQDSKVELLDEYSIEYVREYLAKKHGK